MAFPRSNPAAPSSRCCKAQASYEPPKINQLETQIEHVQDRTLAKKRSRRSSLGRPQLPVLQDRRLRLVDAFWIASAPSECHG